MLHPFFSALIRRPDLVIEHIAGYGSLVHEEVADAGSHLAKQLIAWAIASVFAILFLVFAGVAVMLGLVHGSAHWALLAVPGCALVSAAAAFIYASNSQAADRFAALKTQLKADIDALKHAGARA